MSKMPTRVYYIADDGAQYVAHLIAEHQGLGNGGQSLAVTLPDQQLHIVYAHYDDKPLPGTWHWLESD